MKTFKINKNFKDEIKELIEKKKRIKKITFTIHFYSEGDELKLQLLNVLGNLII